MSQPVRTTLPQFGYRINETGVERWGHFDARYNGANSDSLARMKERAQNEIIDAKSMGFKITVTMLKRTQLTTVWTRWVPGVEELGGSDE